MTQFQAKLRSMIFTAFFAAFIGILAQMTIPLPFVPITGQTLAIGLAATISGWKYGTLSVILYLLIGFAGAPMFAGFQGGISKLFGPTGGYLISFIPTAFVIGFYLEKLGFTLKHAIAANLIGMIVNLTIGTFWLVFTAGLSWQSAFASGFAPFILVGIIKAFLSSWIGIAIRKRLINANLLFIAKTSDP